MLAGFLVLLVVVTTEAEVGLGRVVVDVSQVVATEVVVLLIKLVLVLVFVEVGFTRGISLMQEYQLSKTTFNSSDNSLELNL